MRTLLNGKEVDEIEDVIDIAIHTHCPKKWRFVDLETGDVWGWERGPGFTRAKDLVLKVNK